MNEYLMNKPLENLDWRGNNFSYDRMYRKRTLGDGSCYFHAILDGCFIPYRSETISGHHVNKKKLVQNLRQELADTLNKIRPGYNNKTYYETLSRGELNNLSKEIKEVSLDSLKKQLLSLNSINYIFHEYVSDILNKDIYILDYKAKDVYIIDSNLEMYYKNRKSIVILFIPGHFELVGIKNNKNELITYFHSHHPFIKAIRKRIKTKLAANRK
jgi:hypothetical protein